MRGKVLVGLVLAFAGLAACEHREVYRRSETPPRDWDVAWLVPMNERGQPFLDRSRVFQADAASVELAEEEVAYALIGLSLEALPLHHRRRLDLEVLGQSTLTTPTETREPVDTRAGLVAGGARLELDVDPALPYFDLLGPKWAEDGRAQSATTALSLAVQLPIDPFFCRPVEMVDITPEHDGAKEQLGRRSPLSLERLPDGSILAALRVRDTTAEDQASALLRLRLDQPITPDDVLVMPTVREDALDREFLRQVLVRPLRSPDLSSVWLLRHRMWTDQSVQELKQEGFLEQVRLPRLGPWAALSSFGPVPADGPEWGSFTQAAHSVAESPRGELLVVGGRISGVLPRGYAAVAKTSTGAVSFERHDLTFSGTTNGDILYRVVALPDDPRQPGISRFAIGGRRGEIAIVRYDPEADTLTEVPDTRYVPPPNIMATVGAGYPRMYVVPRPDGFELWAVGFQGLLVRRTTQGRWESFTNRLQANALFDQSARRCTPLGYPNGRVVLDVARRADSALLTLDGCAGALLVRFDQADEPVCATAVRPPGVVELQVDGKNDFEAVVAVEDGYVVAARGGLQLMKVED